MLIRESYLKIIRPLYHNDLIKVLVGIRRCGKSVILQQIIQEIKEQNIPDDHIISINFENLKYRDIHSEVELYTYIEERILDENRYYLFFDEIQNVKNFEKAINSFRATHLTSMFVTGSNGKLLSSDLATYLTGRFIEFHIQPFSFKEFCECTTENTTKNNFKEYQRWGGFPQLTTLTSALEKESYLNDLYTSILTRDIVKHHKAMDLFLLSGIFKYMVAQIGQVFSATSILKYLESNKLGISYPTLQSYLDMFCATMIFQKVQRYDIRGKRVLQRTEKYYLSDIGLYQIVNTSIEPNYGAILENIVYNELLSRDYKIYIGKTYKGEVDFIASNFENKIYIQVCYMLVDAKVIEREFGAFNDIEDNYVKYVISLDEFDFSRNGIRHMNLLDFLNGKTLD